MPGIQYVDTEKLKLARQRFKMGDDADSPQQLRERDDQAFENGKQWPDDILNARAGQAATSGATGMPAVPARPSLVIPKVKEPVRQILNQERSSDIGVELVPADDFGDLGLIPDDTEIKLREGLVRRIQRESNAADARTWAFKRAVIAGRGFYAVMTRYLPGKTSNQEVYVHRIYDQAGVLLDPSHEAPDGSDADWEFLGTWMPWDRAKSEHPKLSNGKDNPFAEASEADLTSMAQEYPDWYQSDGEQRAVRVVQYWYRERKFRELVTLTNEANGQVMDVWADELATEGIQPGFAEIDDSRREAEDGSVIHYCKILGGVLEIESSEWAGPDMPIVKVLGDEVLPYDGKRRAEGVVRPARDSQMGENYMISKFVETVGLAPIPRDTIDPEAIDGYEPWWNAANTRTLPYRPYRTFDDNGKEFRQPYSGNVDANILPIAQGIQLFDGFIQQTTGGSAPDRLGVGQRVQANSAIKRLQEEEQFNTSNFLDNLTRSIRYEGQIENNLLYAIYGARPGRLARILTGEGESEMMQIGDPKQQQQRAGKQAKAMKMAKLTKDANFNVIVKIAKNSDRRRDQFVAMFGDILGAAPEQMLVGGDLFYKNMDIPEAKQLADRMKTMLAPPVQALLAQQESGEEPIPAAAQQQIAQLTERLKMAEGAMQELAKEAEGKQLDAQTKLQVEQLKAQTDAQKAELEAQRDIQLEQLRAATELEKERMSNATSIRVAEIAAETKGIVSAQALEHEAIALAHTQEHEATMAGDQREHEGRVMAHEAATADAGMDRSEAEAARGREATAEQSEADRTFQAEQAERAAEQTETE